VADERVNTYRYQLHLFGKLLLFLFFLFLFFGTKFCEFCWCHHHVLLSLSSLKKTSTEWSNNWK